MMEVFTSNSAPSNLCIRAGWGLVDNCSYLCQSNLNPRRGSRILCVKSDRSCESLRFGGLDKCALKNSYLSVSPKSFHGLQLLQDSNLRFNRANCGAYVVEGDEDVGEIARSGEQSDEISIPGLPDTSAGESGASITSCFWEWRPKLNVHYEKSGSDNVNAPAVLFLPGFGVGSFHYEKQLKDLGRDFRVWALDFVGQGLSLPLEDPTALSEGNAPEGADLAWGFGDATEPWASDLSFSMDLWKDQVQHFVQEVIGEPVYLVGNSLGGFVSLYFAANHPQLVNGITLLNATPFWGFLPNPTRSPKLARMFPWSGTFPLPDTVKKLTEILWEKISHPESIAEILKQVYADQTTDVEKVFSRIVEITQHPAAPASFASIMCSPQGQMSFRESLSGCKTNNIPICLVYGKEDPWVKPFWGLKAKRQVPEAPYYELSPAGHCPHDEVPEVVNYLIRGWIKNLESQNVNALPLLENDRDTQQSFLLKKLEFPRDGARKSVKVKFFGPEFSLLKYIRFSISSRLRRN